MLSPKLEQPKCAPILDRALDGILQASFDMTPTTERSRSTRRLVAIIVAFLLTTCFVGVVSAAGGKLENPALQKAAAKCQQLVGQVTAKLVASKFKALDACVNVALACVQTKQTGRDACFAKAGKSCLKRLSAAATNALKAETKIVGAKSCAKDLRFPDLLAEDGLGLARIGDACQSDFGVDVCGGLPSLAQCLVQSSDRAADALYGQTRPRADELLSLLPVVLPPIDGLPPFPGCGDCAVQPGAGKVVAKCGQVVTKASADLIASLERQFVSCTQNVFACTQTNATTKCFDQATTGCDKGAAAVTAAYAKFAGTLAKSCGSAAVDFDTLAAPTGLDFEALGDSCLAVGAAVPTSLDALDECLRRRVLCTSAGLVRQSYARTAELQDEKTFGDLNDDLDVSCPEDVVALSARTSVGARLIFGSISKLIKSIRLSSNGAAGTPVSGGAPLPRPGAGPGILSFVAPSRVVFGGLTKIPFTYRVGLGRDRAAEGSAAADLPPTMIVSVHRGDVVLRRPFRDPAESPWGCLGGTGRAGARVRGRPLVLCLHARSGDERERRRERLHLGRSSRRR